MTCQGMSAVQAICLAVAGVEKVNALNFAFAQRFSSALGIQWPQLDSCCKTNSTYRQQNVTIVLSVLCSVYNK